MNYQWKLSRAAQESIEAQLIWYEADERHGGVELADRWLAKLELALQQLAKAPTRYSLAPENGRWNPSVRIRQMLFRPWKGSIGWRVLYAVDEKQKVVTILQVRHERRRWLFEAQDDGSSDP